MYVVLIFFILQPFLSSAIPNQCSLVSLKFHRLVPDPNGHELPWKGDLRYSPHVLDRWCEGTLMESDPLQQWLTITTASRNRVQCDSLGRIASLRELRSRFRILLVTRSFRIAPYAAMRVGEASHPGPPLLPTRVIFGITNPTLIYKKSSLPIDLGVDTLMLAETAATKTVQSIETADFRKLGFTSIWGQPMLPHHHHALEGSLKGQAAGVSNHSKFLLRSSHVPSDGEWSQAGRFLDTFVQLPFQEIRILTLYGFPASHAYALQKTNQLLRHAIEIASQTTFPTIICGDLNHHPSDLEALNPLWQKGYRTAESLFQELTGDQLPPTFQEATYNDVAIFPPVLADLVTEIWVDQQDLIAGHNPLCFALQAPSKPLFRQTWKLPKTWLHLDPKKELVAQNFCPTDYTQSTNPLHQWSHDVEVAVHQALKHEIGQSGSSQFPGLPKQCWGRCQPPKLVKSPHPRSLKATWDGHYQPAVDQPTMRIRQLTKQMKRIQSLKQRVKRWQANAGLPFIYWDQMWEEWQCILRAPGFQRSFVHWLQEHPEIAVLPLHLPDEELLYDIEQLLRHHVDQLVYTQNLKHQKLSKFQQQLDAKNYGRAQAFQSVKERGAGLLTKVQICKQWPAQVTTPLQHGLITLSLPSDACIDMSLPFQVNNHPADFVQWNPPDLELAMHDADIQLDDMLVCSQTQESAEPHTVAASLDNHWRQYWDRDLQAPPDTWNELYTMIEDLPQIATLPVDIFEVPRWKQAIRALKSKTARGCCAWAADELKQLPDDCIVSLVQAFQCLGPNGMPAHLMAARTVPLLKKEDAIHPKDTRPITILSLLYRLWGRVISQAVLQYWNRYFPKSVTGFLPGRSAMMPMYHLQVLLEKSHHDQLESWSGLTLDIRKCFNCLPVPPIKALLARLGVPTALIDFWASSHAKIDRCWQIADQIFPTGPQVTGVPEGDSLSDLIMLAYNFMWTSRVEPLGCLANTYADNWSYATNCLRHHPEIFKILLDLTRAMRLEIDWDKTWCWTSTIRQKADLQALMHHVLPPQVEVECLPNAKDLGIILHYRRKQLRKPQRERHAKALKTLKKLQKSVLDTNTKALIANAAVVKSLFGAHTHVTGEPRLKELRTEIVNILVGSHNNVNPFLAATVLSPMILDPELYLIRQTIRFARQYAIQMDVESRQVFFDMVAIPQHKAKRITGPSGALAYYLAKVDWQMTARGELLISAFFKLHLCDSSWQETADALTHSWMQHVSLQMSSRKGYRGMPVVDRAATLTLFASLPQYQQKIAAYAITGGFMLQNQKAKFDPAAEGNCTYCDKEPDSHDHRILRCEATEVVREKYRDICTYLDEHDPVHMTCPVMYIDSSWEMYRQLWQTMPEPELHLPELICPRMIFADGACPNPDNARPRFTANAAVCFRTDAPPLLELAKLPANELLAQGFHVISVSMLQGPQTVARAEFQIVVKLIEAGVEGPIVTDSQYILLTRDLIQTTDDWTHLHIRPNFDLLRRWHFMHWTRGCRPEIHKVKSHQSLQNVSNPLLLQLRLGNAATDEAAKQAVRTLAGPQTCDLQTLIAEYDQHKQVLLKQFSMRYEMGLLLMQLDKPEVALHGGGDPTVLLQRLIDWKVDNPITFQTDNIGQDVAQASRWGTTFTDLFLQWLASLKWSAPDRRRPPFGISWVDLFCNFTLTTQSSVPINIAGKNSNYVTPDQTTQDLDLYEFGHSITSFQRAVEHVQYLSQRRLVPEGSGVKTGSLYYLGSGSCRMGFSSRPQMVMQEATMRFLWQYLSDNLSSGKVSFTVVPKPPTVPAVFHPRFDVPSEDNHKTRFSRYMKLRETLKQHPQGPAH